MFFGMYLLILRAVSCQPAGDSFSLLPAIDYHLQEYICTFVQRHQTPF